MVHGLPEDYYDTYRSKVRAVTTDGVLRAAQRHLHPEQLRIVVVGDPDVIAAPVAAVTGMAPEIVASDGGEVAA